jgi:hypothetical protein
VKVVLALVVGLVWMLMLAAVWYLYRLWMVWNAIVVVLLD